MGMRIHKSLGYGLRNFKSFVKPDCKFDTCGIDSNRFRERMDLNLEDIQEELLVPPPNNADAFFQMFAHFLKSDKEEYGGSPLKKKCVSDCVIYGDEFGNPNFIQFIPPTECHRWKRYNDDLDHAEFMADSKSESPSYTKIKKVKGTIYPYVSLMRGNSLENYQKYWIPCYLDNPQHKDAIAYVPFEIYNLIVALGIFKDPFTTYMSLRPTIYTYWS